MLQGGSSRPTQSVQEGNINNEDGSQVAHNNTYRIQGRTNMSDFMNPVPTKALPSTDSKKTTKKRKYDESYLEVGLTETNDG